MSSTYTDRRWEIYLDDELFVSGKGGRQFKMTFEVLIDYGNYNSYADISIMNLTAETANKAFVRGKRLALRAGYGDSIDTIFTGVIRNVFRRREGANVVTQIIARGGTLVTERPSINEALGEDCTIVDILNALAGVLELPIELEADQFSDVLPYANGYTLTGDPIVYLEDLAETHGFYWVVENGRLVVTRINATRPGPVHIVSQFTGMEGIPVITEVGADVTVRLDPRLRIGGRFKIEATSATFNFSNLYFVDVPESAGKGEYNIFRLTHRGDTTGNDWSTLITGIRPQQVGGR